MRQHQSPDDLRDRIIGILTNPWAPVTAGLLFLLASGAALLSVMLGSHAEDERDALAAIIREARAGNHLQASQLALSMRRPPEQLPKLLEWFYFNDPDTPLDQIDLPTLSAFIDDNQHWPGTRTLEIKREAKLARVRPPAEMLAYYAKHPPVSTSAQRRHLIARLEAGDFDAAASEIRHQWATRWMKSDDERAFEATFGELLQAEDRRRRVAFLLMTGKRTDARRHYDDLDPDWLAFAEAVDADRGGDASLAEALPNDMLRHPAFVVPTVLALDAEGEHEAAEAALLSIPTEMRMPEQEWRARHILIRQALKDQDFDLALGLAQRHGLEDGRNRAEAEWLKGWVALTRLSLPHPAQEAFERSLSTTDETRLRARARYWLAQALRAQGDEAGAENQLEACAGHAHTFYGQACLSALGRKLFDARYPRPRPARGLSDADLAELVTWARTLHEMGINSLGERFLHALNSAARTEDDLAALMTLLDEVGRDDLSLLFAIRAADRGLYNPDALLPQLDIQPARGLRVDEALVHAIAWQESKFRIGAVSRSGALGLMQVLPATAKAMAERHRLPFDEASLTKDARYNLTLGAAYLQDLQRRFEDADLLAIAAYNGGPGNTRRWMREFGDPRTNAIEALVWMESISFGETREYARQVTALYNLYRARIARGAVEILMPRHLLGSRK